MILEREEERERNIYVRKKHQSVASPTHSDCESKLQTQDSGDPHFLLALGSVTRVGGTTDFRESGPPAAAGKPLSPSGLQGL